MLEKTYYTNGKNRFNGVYDRNEWSAPYMVSYEEIKQRIDGFKLIGRKIKDIRAIGMSYIHRRDDIEDRVYNWFDRLGLAEDECKEKSEYENICADMEMERSLEIDEPLLIKFDNDDVFEIVTEQAPEYRMNMNTIPWWITEEVNYPNVEANIIFSNCIGQSIVEIAVNKKIVEEDDLLSYHGVKKGIELVFEIILWLSNGDGLCISPWGDFCEIYCIKRNRTFVKMKMSDFKMALYNWEDIHDDELVGFSSQSSTFYFGEKGKERVDVPYYTVMPENGKSKLRIGENDFKLFEWAMSMVNRELIGIYDDFPEYDYRGWNNVLEEAEKIVSFKLFDEMFDYLMTLKDKGTGKSILLYHINNFGAEFWDNLDKYKQQLKDMKAWTKLVLDKDKKMIVAGF